MPISPVRRANLKGTLTSDAPNYLYWTSSNGQIGRAPLNASGVASCGGTCPAFITTGLNAPSEIAADSEYLYWANTGTNSIGRVRLDGVTDFNATFVQGAAVANPFGIAVDGSYIYWTNPQSGTIGRAPIGGGTASTFVNTGSGTTPYGIAVDSGNVYWGDTANNQIGQAPLNNPASANPNFVNGPQAYTTINQPYGLVVSGGSLFWSNFGMVANPSIGSVPLAHPDQATPNLIPAGTNPYGLAGSERYLYWADAATNSIGSATLSGGSPTTLVPGGTSLVGAAVTPNQFPDLSVDQVTPNPALTQSTVSLTITGTAFDSATTVSVGNQNCGSVQSMLRVLR
ncbi:MAG: hypothetical protein NVV82_21935 [Sporocytophaga sp.]|nr:hypothetical protein [Sporocytophaga sp.]